MRGRTVVMSLLVAVALAVASQALAAEPPIKIGAILSVTGPASFLGAPEARTLEMLVEETNKKGGILGHKVELIVKDSGGSPEKAFSFAKQLIEEDKVFAIIGPSTSGETMGIKNMCQEAKTVLISSFAPSRTTASSTCSTSANPPCDWRSMPTIRPTP